MKTLIIGMGEVGKAHYEILNKKYEVYTKDIEDKEIPRGIEIVHIAFRYGPGWEKTVSDYLGLYNPAIVDILSTVPPGTTAKIGHHAVHSTTRGSHPNLVFGLKSIAKHIGGQYSEIVANYFRAANINCVTHRSAKTTEAAHLLNNIAYGVNLMLADDLQALCRLWDVDFLESVVKYTHTNNEGFQRLDQSSKTRMILTPPNGHIGGHCVIQAANMVPEEIRPQLVDILAKFNTKKE